MSGWDEVEREGREEKKYIFKKSKKIESNIHVFSLHFLLKIRFLNF